MSAGALHGDDGYEPGGGYRPRPRRPRSIRRLLAEAAVWLAIAAIAVLATLYPDNDWIHLAFLAPAVLLVLIGMLPRRVARSLGIGDEYWETGLAPGRRWALAGLLGLIAALALAREFAPDIYEFEGRWGGLLTGGVLILLGLIPLALPRGEGKFDMRPVWAICALLLAILFSGLIPAASIDSFFLGTGGGQ